MRGYFLLLGAVFIASSEAHGWYWFRRKYVTYTIRNQLKEPMFDLNQTVRFFGRVPFIRIMERAANEDKAFRFSANYFDKELGYFITTINGVTPNFTEDASFWSFIKAPNTFLNKGVSNYFPRNREHIIFNLTMGGHE